MPGLRAVICVGLLVLAVGCGEDDTSDTAPETEASADRPGPGTDIGYGLVAPEGTRVTGRPFTGYEGEETGPTRVILGIDADPLAVWADLVEQAATKLSIGLPGSAACQWRSADTVNDQRSLLETRPANAHAVDCQGFALGPLPDGGGALLTSIRMWWEAEVAEVSIEFGPQPGRTDTIAYPGPDPGPAPTDVAEELRTKPRELPEPGDEFGQEENCFETGYTRFRVPDGARFLGGGLPGMALTGVLAVDDPEATLRDLLDQLEGGDGRDLGEYELEQRDGPDGPYWLLHGHIPAGGGSCTIWSTPDNHVVITAHSD